MAVIFASTGNSVLYTGKETIIISDLKFLGKGNVSQILEILIVICFYTYSLQLFDGVVVFDVFGV